MVVEEVEALFPGVLAAAGVQWVDAPWDLLRARYKPLQLACASSLGLAVPTTVISGSPARSKSFALGQHVVAKSSSSGFGIAPYVAAVPASELTRLSECPTALQVRIDADADLRIVTIGDEEFRWCRPRTEGMPVDWREADPVGAGFRFEGSAANTDAVSIAKSLGLCFSVQDWLIVEADAPVFLEVNAQGQWLFLNDAESILSGPLATLLLRNQAK